MPCTRALPGTWHEHGVILQMAMALVHGCGTEGMGIFETADYGLAALRRTAFGRAQASMRLRTAQPMATSVS